jgi:hypothetical protein
MKGFIACSLIFCASGACGQAFSDSLVNKASKNLRWGLHLSRAKTLLTNSRLTSLNQELNSNQISPLSPWLNMTEIGIILKNKNSIELNYFWFESVNTSGSNNNYKRNSYFKGNGIGLKINLPFYEKTTFSTGGSVGLSRNTYGIIISQKDVDPITFNQFISGQYSTIITSKYAVFNADASIWAQYKTKWLSFICDSFDVGMRIGYTHPISNARYWSLPGSPSSTINDLVALKYRGVSLNLTCNLYLKYASSFSASK